MEDKYLTREEFLSTGVTKDECREYRKQIAEQLLEQKHKNDEQDKLLVDHDKMLTIFMQKTDLICKILYGIAAIISSSIIVGIMNLIMK